MLAFTWFGKTLRAEGGRGNSSGIGE